MSTNADTERCALLVDILRAAGELADGDRIAGVEQLEGGWSRYTHVARVVRSGGAESRYVVRVKAPYGLFDTDLAVEYNIFKGLERLDLPTPRVFGLRNSDDNPFGGEFFVMDHMPGTSANVWRAKAHQALQDDWTADRGVARGAVEYLARLHSIPPGEAPEGLPRMTHAAHVERWRSTYEDAGLSRDPIMEEAFDFVAENEPAEERLGVVHGDYRVGNMLIGDGRVTAILDWELAFLGDVRFDLGYISTDYIAGKHLRPKTTLLGGIAEHDWFYDEYERATGLPLDRDVVRTFSVLGLLSLMAMSYTGMSRWADGTAKDIRRAWVCYGLPGMRQELTQLMRW
jgi:aminoglycoside phosphotransferase (APT) family kinase protein